MNDLINKWEEREPLLARAFSAGVRSHIIDVLERIQRVVQEGMTPINEYETEVADVVEEIRSHTSWFEAYALCHDAAWPDELHDKKMHAPAFTEFVQRVCQAMGGDEADVLALHAIVVRHLDLRRDFTKPDPTRISIYRALASHIGWDVDHLMIRLQAVLFIDANDSSLFSNALTSLHIFDPMHRERRRRLRDQIEKRLRNEALRLVGLDGDTLLRVLKMKPGPEFGRVLAEIQQAVVEQRSLPSFTAEINEDLQARVNLYLSFPPR